MQISPKRAKKSSETQENQCLFIRKININDCSYKEFGFSVNCIGIFNNLVQILPQAEWLV